MGAGFPRAGERGDPDPDPVSHPDPEFLLMTYLYSTPAAPAPTPAAPASISQRGSLFSLLVFVMIASYPPRHTAVASVVTLVPFCYL